MSTAHNFTPGPWTFSKDDQYGDVRFYVAQQNDAPYTPNYSDIATLIAETVSSERKSIQEANACLIAAAPELLAALKQVMKWIDNWSTEFSNDPDWPSDRDAARAALAKAVQS